MNPKIQPSQKTNNLTKTQAPDKPKTQPHKHKANSPDKPRVQQSQRPKAPDKQK